MKYSLVFLAMLVLAGFSFAVLMTCDQEITAAGTYTPTADLAATAASNCVNISASNVLINCNNSGTLQSIDGTGAASAFFINHSGLSNITVRNCGVYNFTDYGFNDDTYGANNVTIIGGGFYSNGFGAKFVGNGTTVTDSSFIGSSGHALQIFGNNPEVTGTQFQHNGGTGLLVRWSNNTEFTDNYFYNNSAGLSLDDGNQSTIAYNTFDGDTNSCIYLDTLDNADVQRNNLTYCGFYGVEAYDLLNTEFSNNTILNPWMGGFFINITNYDWNTNVDLLNNTVNWSFNYTATYPDAAGIVLYNATDSEVRGNILANNNATGLSLIGLYNTEVTGNQVRNNQFSTGSHGYGVAMLYSDEILFENNIVEGNGYDASTTGFGGMLLGSVTNSVFSSNNISDNAERNAGSGLPFGIAALDLENVTFDQNAISNNNGTGLFLSADETTANEGIEVTDSLFASQADGVTITDSPDLVLTGNSVESNLGYGALVWRCNGSLVQDNSFEWNENDTAAGMYLIDSYYGTVDTNDFTGNGNGLYLEDTNRTNVTDNGFVGNGVGLLDYQSDALLISGNIFNQSTNLTSVALTSYFSTFTGNLVHNNTYEGVLVINSIYVNVTDNIIRDNDMANSFPALEIAGSNNTVVSGNEIYDNYHGVFTDASHNLTVMQNDIYDNVATGIWLHDSDDALVDQNTLTGAALAAFEIYLDDCSGANVTDNDLLAAGLVFSGMAGNALASSEFSGNTVNGVYGIGVTLDNGSTSTTMDSDVVTGAVVGFVIYSSDDVTLTGTESYGNIFGYSLDDYANVTIVDAVSYDNSETCLEVAPGNATLDNFRAWACGTYISMDENSTINATDLWVGYDNTYGIHYGAIVINDTTVVDTANVLLDRTYVSMNSSDTNVLELNVSANITISVDGCSNLQHYNASGFPQTRAEVLAGNTFTPAYSTCGSRATVFQVPGFSGYAASGVTLTSTGDGSSTFTMSVTGERAVGEELTITVLDGTTPVSGADVKVFYWLNGVLQVQDLGNTNSQGKVAFTPAFAASFKATATKSGYSEQEARFIVSAAATTACSSDADCAAGRVCTAGMCVLEAQEQPAEEPEQPAQPGTEQPAGTAGCASNADCAYNEACSSGNCVAVPAGACGEYSNHAWIGYNCCAAGDCGVGYACTNHNCVQSGPTEAEVPGTGGAAGLPSSAPSASGGTPWLLVVVAVVIGAAAVWWLFVRKP
jgi:parallel beta-helix repeat protein